MDKIKTREMMSALADGQLHGDAFAHAVEAVAADPAARQAWLDYHLIGDVMRSGELARGVPAGAFVDRLSQRLAREPAPRAASIGELHAPAQPVLGSQRSAANDGSFRWKLVAGFASLAAVAAVGWSLVSTQALPSAQPQLAVAPAVPQQAAPAEAVVAGSGRGVMIRDPRLDELMAAHRQLGSATALQMPAGFLRNATFEGPAR